MSHRFASLLVFSVLVGACAAEPVDDDSSGLGDQPGDSGQGEGTGESPPNEEPDQGGSGQEDPPEPPNGDLDFHVFGHDLEDVDGLTVYAVAIEHDGLDQPIESYRVVDASATIEGGSFSILATDALTSNFNYPSYGVFIDIDDDGLCGDGDLGYVMQLYGWEQDIDEEITSVGWHEIPSSALLGTVVGSGQHSSFCEAYFD